MGRRGRGPDWRLAKDVLVEALAERAGDPRRVRVGWVERLDEGLYHRAFRATCRVVRPSEEGAEAPEAPPQGAEGVADGEERVLVARLPLPDGPADQAERARREARLLDRLGGMELPVRLPRVVGAVPVPDGVALVQELVAGLPLDLRAGRGRFDRPWELVARAAAACHGVDPAELRDVVPGFETCRDHARACLRELAELDLPEAAEALAWAEAHLPPAEPAVLLHGDLLGQNLLVNGRLLDPTAAPEEHELGVIDWFEAVIGDPGYDLAIVTRGVRRPFGTGHGRRKLLDAYAACSGRPLEPARVHLHELWLAGGFYRQAVESHGEGSAHAENVRKRLTGLVSRVCG